MTCLSHASDVEQFARDNKDIVQVVGVGALHDFEDVQEFINKTDLETVPLLWEHTSHLWLLNDTRIISGVQLHSFDFGRHSDVVRFSERAILLDAAIQIPWSPVDRRPDS